MQKTILYYKFVPVPDPDMARKWQTLMAAERGLRGRVIISEHGINGTLGGDVEALEDYIEQMEGSGVFADIEYKWGTGGFESFPKLSVKYRDELVSFKAADEIKVDSNGIVGGGLHLKPEQLHELMQNRGEEVIFYDGRNAYEAEVGRFKGTIVPNVRTTKDFKADLESGEIARFKSRPIVTYCTGGIRCEVLSLLMKNRGFKEVYQIDGGIVRYGEKYRNDGLWDGKLYVFDKRMVEAFDESAEDIGQCELCPEKTSEFANCDNKGCNKLVVMCVDCQATVKRCPSCNSSKIDLRVRRQLVG